MAALYLHNAIFTPDPSEISRSSSIFPHSRNVSTATATTLHANASEQSHTREPLLHSTTSESWAYADPFSRQATLFNEPGRLEWGTHPPFLGDPPTLRETKIFWEKKIRKRMRRLRYLMRLLEVIFGGWAIYNTTRYFLAFTKYDSVEGQHVSLALGISTSVSFALLAAAVCLKFFKLHLLMHAVPLRLVTIMIVSFLGLSSTMLITPAIVNMAMLFVWRSRSDHELSTETRCQVDIDVVWSSSRQSCTEPYGWSAWMALSATRLGLTAILIVFYYAFLVAYERTRRSTKWVNPAYLQVGRRSGSIHLMPSPEIAQVSSNHDLAIPILHQEASHSTMISTSPSRKTSLHISRSSVSVITTSESHTKYAPSVELDSGTEYETMGISDRFRSIVSQINHETNHAVALARSDHSSDSSSSSHPSNDQAYAFYPPPIPPSIGYNEFGQPYPPEEAIPILNGYIRRMPTIESMGSREIASTNRGSSVNSGSILDRFASPSNSRSQTRISFYLSGSEPPSRPNSLSQRAIGNSNGVGSGTNGMEHSSEVGELIPVSNERRSSPSSPLSQTVFDLSTSSSSTGGQGTNSQSSRGSSIPTAYYTATIGSMSSDVPSSVEEKDES
ncbi:hypothetical protein Agabi119p4_11405 [Agaricus bisporus var. burnettii]|uniref:Uncharacterized protein n=1 Tax=Agaricus bisporus var. burnettii TaxID=192524 RepID=A0A8H7C050_AGABI|nr:hypothetical protein Agabi119p4_11405 [Agaricus bisporus var. burnettii]